MKQKIQLKQFLFLILLLTLLPLLIFASQQAIKFLTRAAGTPANITINTALKLEPITKSWGCFAQGGEETKNMLSDIVSETKLLKPTYIRIDHLYDHHPIVKRENGQLIFDFSDLDPVVKNIQQTGAVPLLSLSYMPAAISQNGDILGKPNNWNEWALVVQKTIEHYSGKNSFNLKNVYYEVWNEPDLFGTWKPYGDKNYLTLYQYAAIGAQNAQNVNTFKIGGPATTQLYKNWVTSLVEYVGKNNLRLDFVSWHRYNYDPTQFATDAKDVTSWLFNYPTFTSIPRLITEWGFDPENNAGYDGNFAAAHAIATIRQALNGYEQLCTFELVDGPPPEGKTYWGRWGLVTHPTTGKMKKPRYQSFLLLNQLAGNRISITGEGTWVTGIATKYAQTIQLLLSNFDAYGTHAETVPLHFIKLEPGNYTLKETRLGQDATIATISVTDGIFDTQIIMPQNSVILIELIKENTNPFLRN